MKSSNFKSNPFAKEYANSNLKLINNFLMKLFDSIADDNDAFFNKFNSTNVFT